MKLHRFGGLILLKVVDCANQRFGVGISQLWEEVFTAERLTFVLISSCRLIKMYRPEAFVPTRKLLAKVDWAVSDIVCGSVCCRLHVGESGGR